MKLNARRSTRAAAMALIGCMVTHETVGGPPPPLLQEPAPTDRFLTIGDQAPALDAAHWLRGEEIGYFEPGRIYVVAFWSTWCKYCHASFPTLSRVQSERASDNVIVLGISDEKLQTVFEFLVRPEWNEQVTFSVATDPDLSVQRDYMEAAAIGDIPTVFLVGRAGTIEWIGHPHRLDEPLQAVIDGTWDRDACKSAFEDRMEPARARYRQMREMKLAYEQKDWDRLLLLFDQAIESDTRAAPLKIQKFLLMIGDMGRVSGGYAYGRTLLREFWDDASQLNQLAWLVVDHETVQDRDLEFAMKAAERACTLTEYADAPILDTLARVYFEQGDLASALEWQRKAVQQLDSADPLAPIIQAALENYEEKSRQRTREAGDDSVQ